MCRRLTSNEDVGGSARVQVVLVDAVVALHSESSYFSCAPKFGMPQIYSRLWRIFWCCCLCMAQALGLQESMQL